MDIDAIRRKESAPNSVDMTSAAWEEEKTMDQIKCHIYSLEWLGGE